MPNPNDEYVKIHFPVPPDDESIEQEFQIESLWAKVIADGRYEINNIPFYIKNLAVGDIISASYDEEDQVFYPDEFLQASGNSVVRLLVYNSEEIEKIGAELKSLACDWEGLMQKNLIAVHIPTSVDYEKAKEYFDENTDRFDYEEACLGFL